MDSTSRRQRRKTRVRSATSSQRQPAITNARIATYEYLPTVTFCPAQPRGAKEMPEPTPSLRRIGLIGGEGSGKTTLATALASALPACAVDEGLRAFVDREGRTPRRERAARPAGRAGGSRGGGRGRVPARLARRRPRTADDSRLQPPVLRRRLPGRARRGGRPPATTSSSGAVPTSPGHRTASSATEPGSARRSGRDHRAAGRRGARTARDPGARGPGCRRRPGRRREEGVATLTATLANLDSRGWRRLVRTRSSARLSTAVIGCSPCLPAAAWRRSTRRSTCGWTGSSPSRSCIPTWRTTRPSSRGSSGRPRRPRG